MGKIPNQQITLLCRLFNPFKWWLIALFCVTGLLAISYSLSPYALKSLLNALEIDNASWATTSSMIAVVFYLLANLFPVIVYRLHNFVWVELAPSLRRHISQLSVEKIIYFPYSFFSRYNSPEIGSLIKEMTQTLPEAIKLLFDGLISGILTLVVAVATVSTVHFKFAIGLFLWVSIFLTASIFFLYRAKQMGYQATEIRSRIHSKIVEIFDHILSIKLFRTEGIECDSVNHQLSNYYRVEKVKEKITVKTFAFQGFSFVLYQCICVFWLMQGFDLGKYNLGDIALILTINFSFVDYFRKISRDIVVLADLMGGIQKSMTLLLAHQPCKNEKCHSETLKPSMGEINCNQVCFRYQTSSPLFENLNLHIKPGTKIAIVGASGSGKSTFIHLIAGLHPLESGSIFIDNCDNRFISSQEFKEKIAFVPQKISLFAGTIFDNIQYGNPPASFAEVLKVAKQAGVDQFVSQLPEGYATLVDGSGSPLSAGQQQRIGIARAMLKNAPLLICDEPMSHLDPLTQSHVQNNLMEFVKNKTALFITHHYSSFLFGMDEIIVFSHGSILERGTHDELINKRGKYAKIWETRSETVHSRETEIAYI